MPAPRWLARFNRRATNRLTKRFADRVPGLGIIVHRGRKTGRMYRTPLNVFKTRSGYAIALTYGPSSEWVRNVLSAGGCELETQGRRLRLSRPRVIRDESRRLLPNYARLVLGLLRVNDFLELTLDDHGAASPSPR